jgi:hypothetical protein
MRGGRHGMFLTGTNLLLILFSHHRLREGWLYHMNWMVRAISNRNKTSWSTTRSISKDCLGVRGLTTVLFLCCLIHSWGDKNPVRYTLSLLRWVGDAKKLGERCSQSVRGIDLFSIRMKLIVQLARELHFRVLETWWPYLGLRNWNPKLTDIARPVLYTPLPCSHCIGKVSHDSEAGDNR